MQINKKFKATYCIEYLIVKVFSLNQWSSCFAKNVVWGSGIHHDNSVTSNFNLIVLYFGWRSLVRCRSHPRDNELPDWSANLRSRRLLQLRQQPALPRLHHLRRRHQGCHGNRVCRPFNANNPQYHPCVDINHELRNSNGRDLVFRLIWVTKPRPLGMAGLYRSIIMFLSPPHPPKGDVCVLMEMPINCYKLNNMLDFGTIHWVERYEIDLLQHRMIICLAELVRNNCLVELSGWMN